MVMNQAEVDAEELVPIMNHIGSCILEGYWSCYKSPREIGSCN